MRSIISINDKWAFTKNSGTLPETMPSDWESVTLPHSWNSTDGQDGGNDYYRGTCYYARELKKSELAPHDRYHLEIEGANSSADVYLNGVKLGHHDGGYSTFRIDLTDSLKDDNLLVIAVDNSPSDTVYPQVADFTFYGGLYRNVNVVGVSNTHFDLEYYGGPGLMITPKVCGKDASVEVEVFV